MARVTFTLTSPAFEGNEQIGREHTCDGANTPPPLEWSHAPEETRSFAMIMDDQDAPGGTFTHWTSWDIPGMTDTVDPTDVSQIGVSGRNDFQGVGYGGPCPPPHHPPHRYRFMLHALDVDTLDLEPGATREQLEQAMQDHVLATAELVGRYARAPRTSRS